MTRLYPRVWQPGLERVLGASRRMTDGLDSSALGGEGASPWESEKLGVSLFPGRGEEAERPGYCVLRAHMVLEEMVSPLRTGRWESRCTGESGEGGRGLLATGDLGLRSWHLVAGNAGGQGAWQPSAL